MILMLEIGLKSQEYIPFPTENVNWNVYLLSTYVYEFPPDTVLLRYTIHGDTTINEILYSKLCLESGDTINPKIQAIGGLREVGKKIYYIGRTILGSERDGEYLLYDFTKQTGDTIKHDDYGSFYSIILNIDSIMIDGTYQKRYQVDNHWFYHNPDYIIEGIGSIQNGLLGHISDIPTCGQYYWEHICFRENGVVKYLNPSFDNCFPAIFFTNINGLSFNSEINIYPNPIDNKLYIENNTNEYELLIKIFDINGRILIEEHFADSEKSIYLTLDPGIFNIQITNKQGKILRTEKIIIK
jgi:hypothetical protein